MRCLLVGLFFVQITFVGIAQTGEIRGQVKDSLNREIPFASITVFQNDTLISESVTDSSGRYAVKNLKIRKYDVLCEKKHFRGNIVCGVLVVIDKISFVDFKLHPLAKASFMDSAIDTTFYKVPKMDAGYVPKCGSPFSQ
jgi:hypothetical protein